MKKITFEEFINRSNLYHNFKYCYDKVEYTGFYNKICIICPIHGEFMQCPAGHVKTGCKKCKKSKKRKYNIKTFIEAANKKHNFKYSYEKTVYVLINLKVIITCEIHGDFKQLPETHLKGSGCPRCSRNVKITKDEFIEMSNLKFDNKFDYSEIEFKNYGIDPIKIICPMHGDFFQIPSDHVKSKTGCSKCSGKRKLTTEEFIERANKVHNCIYTYENSIYNGMFKYVIITCSVHGKFSQMAVNHLAGNGCPTCKLSRGEETIKNFLEKNQINYVCQYRFNECKNLKPLPFDFAIIDENNNLQSLIEYQGIQHYQIGKRYKSLEKNKNEFEKRIKHDNIKRKFCHDNKIKLIEIPYWDYKNIADILKAATNV